MQTLLHTQTSRQAIRNVLGGELWRHYEMINDVNTQAGSLINRLFEYITELLPAPVTGNKTDEQGKHEPYSLFEFILRQAVLAWEEAPQPISVRDRYTTLVRALLYNLPRAMEYRVCVERTDLDFDEELGPEVEIWDCVREPLPAFLSRYTHRGLELQIEHVGLEEELRQRIYRDVCLLLAHHVVSRKDLRFFGMPDPGKSAIFEL